jgi:hypothetical protein
MVYQEKSERDGTAGDFHHFTTPNDDTKEAEDEEKERNELESLSKRDPCPASSWVLSKNIGVKIAVDAVHDVPHDVFRQVLERGYQLRPPNNVMATKADVEHILNKQVEHKDALQSAMVEHKEEILHSMFSMLLAFRENQRHGSMPRFFIIMPEQVDNWKQNLKSTVQIPCRVYFPCECGSDELTEDDRQPHFHLTHHPGYPVQIRKEMFVSALPYVKISCALLLGAASAVSFGAASALAKSLSSYVSSFSSFGVLF